MAVFDFTAFFGSPVTLPAPGNAIVLEAEAISTERATANPALARASDRIVVDHPARFERGDIKLRVRAQMIELLPGGKPPRIRWRGRCI